MEQVRSFLNRATKPFRQWRNGKVGRVLSRIWKIIIRLLVRIHILIVVLVYIGIIAFVVAYLHNRSLYNTSSCSSDDVVTASQSVVFVTGDNATGSAFWISSNYLLTNNHVVDHNPNLKIYEGKDYDATVLVTDSFRDIAILGIVNPPAHGTLKGYQYAPSITDDVYSIGYPEGSNLTINKGIISATTSDGERSYFQTDAAISPGNSGGPLVNDCGQVVGIDTESLSGAQNVNYALDYAEVNKQVKVMLASLKTATPQEISQNYPTEQAEVVAKYYTTLSDGDFQGAYDFYSTSHQVSVPFDSWEAGQSDLVFINLESVDTTNQANTIKVRFYVSSEATNGGLQTREFEGTWTLVEQNGLWKMDRADIQDITGSQ